MIARFVTGLMLIAFAHLAIATEPVQFNYMMNCQGCHLANGEGFPARNVPALKGHLGKFLQVKGGREFLIQVPGSAQSDLTDEQLAEVINWMLTNFSPEELPAEFTPYSVEEVSSLRSQPIIDVSGVRANLMALIQQPDQT